MTIASELQGIVDAKAAIRQALDNKGLSTTDELSTYASLIDSLYAEGVVKPSIISPVNGAAGVSHFPMITASSYWAISESELDPHQDSLWEFASDAAFSNILHTSGWTAEQLENYEVARADRFDGGVSLYVRVTYRGESGDTSTSDPILFETGLIDIGSVIDGDIVYGQMGGDWLLAAPAEKRSQQRWGLYGIDTSLPNIWFGSDPNTGKYNTDVLTGSEYNSVVDNQGFIGCPAAEYCRSLGYDLPNHYELNMLFLQREVVDDVDATDGMRFSGLTAEVLSSSERSSTEVRVVSFLNGTQGSANKNSFGRWVTPIKRVPV